MVVVQIQRGWGTQGSRYRGVGVHRGADTEWLGYTGEVTWQGGDMAGRGMGVEGWGYRGVGV